MKKSAITIVDRKESLPMRVNHATRKWEIFNPKTNQYEDTGLAAVPEDDATAIKYYKLSNTPTAPTAVGDSQTSWLDIASLNVSVITNGGWSADPLQVSLENRFCWAAYYSLENVRDAATNTYTQKYKLNMVGLYNNYAASPTIEVGDDGVITITNPDGTTQKVNLMTAESYRTLMSMVTGLQSQVDSAVYSYSGSGVPSKSHSKAPLNTWGIENDAPSNVIADIYNAHIGDTYTNTDDYVSYRFVLKEGASASSPTNYSWEVIPDNTLSNALKEIAMLGNSSVKIFTAQPTAPYKVGDIWIQKSGKKTAIKTCVIAKDENGSFSETDWITPFATKEEVEVIRKDLKKAKTDLQTAKKNLSELTTSFNKLENETLKAMEDYIIDTGERKSLEQLSNRLDVEQEQLLSNVTYIKGSKYLPNDEKTALENASNNLLANGGSLDTLQAKITAILNPNGDQGNVISSTEKQDYETALSTYKSHHKALSKAIKNAQIAIDKAIKKYVDDIEIGGKNLVVGNNKLSSRLLKYDNAPLIITKDDGNSVSFYTGSGDKTHLLKAFYAIKLSEELQEGEECIFSVFVQNTRDDDTPINISVRGIAPYQTQALLPSDGMKRLVFKGKRNDYEYLQLFFKGKDKRYSVSAKFEKVQLRRGTLAVDFSTAPEDIQAEMNALITSVDVEYILHNSATKAPAEDANWQTVAPSPQVGKYMWSRQVTTLKDGTIQRKNTTCIQGADGKGIKNIEEQYYLSESATDTVGGSWKNATNGVNHSDNSKYIWTRTKITYTDGTHTTTAPLRSTGVRGEDALSISISSQGHFRNYWENDEEGNPILKKEVVGGVMVDNVEVVQCELLIRKGSKDVTDSALADPSTKLKWYVNGTQRQIGGKFLNLPITFCDGNDDKVEVQYNDSNAQNW